MSKAPPDSDDSGTDKINEMDHNDLRSHVAEETGYKATGDIDTCGRRLAANSNPKSKTTARTASTTLTAAKEKPPSRKTTKARPTSGTVQR